MKHGRIQIVDEGNSHKRLRELLEDYAYDIEVSMHVEDAFEEIKRKLPNLVIIDIHIKDKMGIHLCERLTADEQTKSIMVVFMAVSGFPYMIAQAYKAGAKDFITKPFSPFETVLRIKSLMDLALAQLDIKKTREMERCARIEAEEALKIKSQFLAVMSHEIRTPLNAIIGFSNILEDEDLGQDHKEMVGTIKGSSGMLLNIVNDILDVTKIESGQIELDESVFDLEDIVFQAAETARTSMKTDLVEMNVDMSVDSKIVIGDGFRVKQILSNLLSNAVKFTSCGEIILKIRNVKNKYQFTVSDTGIGMSQLQKSRVFTPFVQADSSSTRKFGGTGLGLSISKSFVNAMGGDLSVDSHLGEGSTFSFEINLVRDERSKLQVVEKRVNQKILILDDNLEFKAILTRKLERMGATVVSSSEWHTIPEEHQVFDTALIDIIDKQYLTSTFVSKIKKKYSIKNCIAIHNRENKNLEDLLDKMGYDNHIIKPVRTDALLKAVNKPNHKQLLLCKA